MKQAPAESWAFRCKNPKCANQKLVHSVSTPEDRQAVMRYESPTMLHCPINKALYAYFAGEFWRTDRDKP